MMNCLMKIIIVIGLFAFNANARTYTSVELLSGIFTNFYKNNFEMALVNLERLRAFPDQKAVCAELDLILSEGKIEGYRNYFKNTTTNLESLAGKYIKKFGPQIYTNVNVLKLNGFNCFFALPENNLYRTGHTRIFQAKLTNGLSYFVKSKASELIPSELECLKAIINFGTNSMTKKEFKYFSTNRTSEMKSLISILGDLSNSKRDFREYQNWSLTTLSKKFTNTSELPAELRINIFFSDFVKTNRSCVVLNKLCDSVANNFLKYSNLLKIVLVNKNTNTAIVTDFMKNSSVLLSARQVVISNIIKRDELYLIKKIIFTNSRLGNNPEIEEMTNLFSCIQTNKTYEILVFRGKENKFVKIKESGGTANTYYREWDFINALRKLKLLLRYVKKEG